MEDDIFLFEEDFSLNRVSPTADSNEKECFSPAPFGPINPLIRPFSTFK